MSLHAEPHRVMIYGEEGNPPFSFTKNGKPSGIYTRVLQTAFLQMDRFDVEIQLVPWKRALDATEAGTILAMYPPYLSNAEKRPFIDLYSIPLLDENVVLICHDPTLGNPENKWPDDYENTLIGINAGYGGGPLWDSLLEQNFISAYSAPNTEQNLTMLSTKRIDCFLNERIATLSSLSTLIRNERIPSLPLFIGPVVRNEQGYLAYSKNHHLDPALRTEFSNQLNQIITIMQENGEIEKIINMFK